MPEESGFKSIAEALAAAEKKRSEATAAAAKKGPWFGSGTTGPGSRPVPAARAAVTAAPMTKPTAKIDELKDDFDYAIEALEMARKAMSRDAAAATTMATNILAAKRKLPRPKAADLIKRAANYLDR